MYRINELHDIYPGAFNNLPEEISMLFINWRNLHRISTVKTVYPIFDDEVNAKIAL